GAAFGQRLGDPRLELVLEQVVHRAGADVDVELDTVPARVIGLERLLGGCGIALLQRVDGVNQRRPYRLDAGDLEALLRGRWGHHAKDGQGREQSDGNAADVLHHGHYLLTRALRLTGRSRGVSHSLTKLEERGSESCPPHEAQLVIIPMQENCGRPQASLLPGRVLMNQGTRMQSI